MTGSILGPSGSPMVELGGERAWRSFTKGDIVASLQWIDVQRTDYEFPESGPVPCMCLYHAHRRMDTGAYVIPQRNAFQYALASGDGIPDSFKASVLFAVGQLGFDIRDKAAVHRVFDIVLEAMPDLIKMPSEQPRELDLKRQMHGIEVTAKVNGQFFAQEVL